MVVLKENRPKRKRETPVTQEMIDKARKVLPEADPLICHYCYVYFDKGKPYPVWVKNTSDHNQNHYDYDLLFTMWKRCTTTTLQALSEFDKYKDYRPIIHEKVKEKCLKEGWEIPCAEELYISVDPSEYIIQAYWFEWVCLNPVIEKQKFFWNAKTTIKEEIYYYRDTSQSIRLVVISHDIYLEITGNLSAIKNWLFQDSKDLRMYGVDVEINPKLLDNTFHLYHKDGTVSSFAKGKETEVVIDTGQAKQFGEYDIEITTTNKNGDAWRYIGRWQELCEYLEEQPNKAANKKQVNKEKGQWLSGLLERGKMRKMLKQLGLVEYKRGKGWSVVVDWKEKLEKM